MSLDATLQRALERRAELFARLHAEGTDGYRLFHGVAEGLPGLTIDRYGGLVLVQTFRDPLSEAALGELEAILRDRLSWPFALAYNHRGKQASEPFSLWHQPAAEALGDFEVRELGTRFHIRARHAGLDPWLFLDLRAGRRALRSLARGKSVLNLFAYTCGVGVSAAVAGAAEVWNVDFAASSLEVGRRNAALNGVDTPAFRTIEEDCLPVMRQLAGLPAGGRPSRRLRFQKVPPRTFDLVFLDPPAWAKSPFGAVDVAGDYPSVFKPALLATRSGGGRVLATHHVASVDFDAWEAILRRCAEKAGRPLRSVTRLGPDEDFPSFDGRPPLKIAVCEV